MIYIIVAVGSLIIGGVVGSLYTAKKMLVQLEKANQKAQKHFQLYLLMNQWVNIKQKGVNLADALREKNYKKIAIYGMSYVGERLVEELKNTDIVVAYAIDKKANDLFSSVDVVLPEAELLPVDAVVVTTITFFDEVEDMLTEKMECPIIAIDDLMYGS